jgi:hypothetical protein
MQFSARKYRLRYGVFTLFDVWFVLGEYPMVSPRVDRLSFLRRMPNFTRFFILYLFFPIDFLNWNDGQILRQMTQADARQHS